MRMSSMVCFIRKLMLIYWVSGAVVPKLSSFFSAPSVFKILFDLVKPLISMRTMKKIDIFGYDREKWEKAILATVPAEELPKRWGGTRETNDEFCSSEVSA